MAATTYSEELATAICDRLIAGESMRRICEDAAMPSETTVYRWLQSDEHAGFRELYARAREVQAHRMGEEILEIADDSSHDTVIGDSGPKPDSEWISRSKLRVDARKWLMAKMAPKVYGDKLDVTSGDKPLAAPSIQIIAPS